MNRMITWLANKILPESEPPEPPLWQTTVRSSPRPVLPKVEYDEPVEYTPDVGGRIADGGPGKNVLIRSRYLREDTGTHETLRIIANPGSDHADEDDSDPYNSGRFDRSKSWNSYRSRK
jgi:hypothetical protein